MRTGRLSSSSMARIRPFAALRYDVPELDAVVAPPYDVISDAERAALQARSPYNVVHLTLPDSEEQAARDLAAWREAGVLVDDGEPSYWWLAQDYVGPDGVERTREGFVAALHLEPYDRRDRAAARTHACRPEGRTAATVARDAHAPRADPDVVGRFACDRRSRRSRARCGRRRCHVAPVAARRGVRRGAHRRVEGRAAADRRRTSSLRDRARVSRRGWNRRVGVAHGRDRPDQSGRLDDLPHASPRTVGRRCERHADRPSG